MLEGRHALLRDLYSRRPAILAPLEDVSDAVFRRLCRDRGAEICLTEFVNVEGLLRGCRNARRKMKLDGETMTGWFTEDFTLAEIKTLRARERLPALRPANCAFDGRFSVPTFDEIMRLAQGTNRARSGRSRIGVYPETKHPAHFQRLGLAQERPVLETLERHGYAERRCRWYSSWRRRSAMWRALRNTHIASASPRRWRRLRPWPRRMDWVSRCTPGRFGPRTSFSPMTSG